MATFDKQPGEAYPIGFEFYGRLPKGATITSASASAHNVTDNVNADSDVLQAAAGVVVGTMVRIGVKGGTVGKQYKITCKAYLSTGAGDNLEEERTMRIVEL